VGRGGGGGGGGEDAVPVLPYNSRKEMELLSRGDRCSWTTAGIDDKEDILLATKASENERSSSSNSDSDSAVVVDEDRRRSTKNRVFVRKGGRHFSLQSLLLLLLSRSLIMNGPV
jgi:hypothetical protein